MQALRPRPLDSPSLLPQAARAALKGRGLRHSSQRCGRCGRLLVPQAAPHALAARVLLAHPPPRLLQRQLHGVRPMEDLPVELGRRAMDQVDIHRPQPVQAHLGGHGQESLEPPGKQAVTIARSPFRA